MTPTLSPETALSIVENCPLPLLVMDAKGRAISCNRAFTELLGNTQTQELMGHAAGDMGDHPSRMLLESAHTLCWTDHHSIQHHFEIRAIALHSPEGAQARLFVDISRQISVENAHDALNEELKQHILTDTATGLLNRRGVTLALEPQVARSRRYNSPIAVVMMDVESQDEPEQTRLEVARLLKDQLRWADLVGITEDRAFILVLPETSAEAAGGLAEKLRHKLQTPLDRPLELHFGVAQWQRSDSADSLLTRASRALKQAHAVLNQHTIAS